MDVAKLKAVLKSQVSMVGMKTPLNALEYKAARSCAQRFVHLTRKTNRSKPISLSSDQIPSIF